MATGNESAVNATTLSQSVQTRAAFSFERRITGMSTIMAYGFASVGVADFNALT